MENNIESLINEAIEISQSFLQREKAAEAEIVLKQILKVDENNEKALQLLGLAKYGNKKYDEAIEIFTNLIKINNNPEHYNNLSLAYSAKGQFHQALDSMKQAVQLDPTNSYYYGNLGLIYRQTDDLDMAIEQFKKAIELNSKNVYAWTNLGSAYGKKKNLDQAIECLQTASEIDPKNKTIHVNLAYAYLLKGDMEQGWEKYENRIDTFKQLEYFKKIYPQEKRWTGQDLKNKTILVYGEQGVGDTIQFIRFVPDLAKIAGKVVLHTTEDMIKLFLPNMFDLKLNNIKTAYTPHEYDYHCSLMSLPHLLKIGIKSEERYIRTNVAANLKNYTDFYKIGIVWGGNPRHPNDMERSCRLAYFKPLQLPGVKLFSLQKDLQKRQYTISNKPVDLTEGCEDMSIVDMSSYLINFQNTAMIIESLDLVISVDTAVLHLAGAMGKKAWGLIPFNPDWRWGLEGDTTPWYPSVKLFRQPEPNNWKAVFENVKEELLKGEQDD